MKEPDIEAIVNALKIHKQRFKLRIWGTRMCVRETIHFRYERPLGRGGKWGAPRYITKAAKKAPKNQRTFEHILPARYGFDRLVKWKVPTIDQVRAILDKWYTWTAIATKAEAEKLRAAGLASKMPENWSGKPKDCLCRYEAVGIEVEENSR